MSTLFSSSVGKKLIMSLAGLFLIIFLLLHLGINLLVLLDDPETFNKAAHFMGSNPLIRIMEYVLFGGFLLHMIYGMILSLLNWLARPIRYKKANYSQTSFFSKYMFHTSVVIAAFLVLHLLDFWVKARFLDKVPDVIYEGEHYHDMATLVITRFKIAWVVIAYVVTLLGLGFHLHHGFQSAFQTLGLNHPVYTPVIKGAGLLYTIVVTLGFIAIPVVVYFFK
jgi:succinate dehydrogenase / fumarate reductase, cytochrome b subunit